MTDTFEQLKTAIIQDPIVVPLDISVFDAMVHMAGQSDSAPNSEHGDPAIRISPNNPSGSGYVVVVDRGRVVGLLTERDIVRLTLQRSPLEQLTLRQVLNRPPVTIAASALTDLDAVLTRFQHHQIRHLPIVDDDDRLVGVISCESLQPLLSAIALEQVSTCERLQAELVVRQQIEGQLGDSERRYASLVAASPVGIMHVDVEGICTYANDRYGDIIGIEPAALIGQVWHQGYHPQELPRIQREFERSLRENRPFGIEYRIQRPDGTEVWVYGQGVVEYDDDGQAIGYVGTVTDISDRKRTEFLLESQHQVLERIANAEPLPAILDALLQTTEFHLPGTLCSILLCEAGHLRQAAAPSLSPDYCEAVDGAPIGEGVGSCGTAAFRRDVVIVADIATDPLWQNYRELASAHNLRACWSAPILSSEGALLGVFGIYYQERRVPQPQDIERLRHSANIAGIAIERSQATQALHQLNQNLESLVEERTAALRASEERWQLAVMGSNDAIWDWDLENNKKFYSSLWKEMRGFSEDEIGDLPAECLGRVHPEDYESVMAALLAHFAGETKLFATEYRSQCKDGSYIWISTRGTALRDHTGKAIRIIGSETDITDRKNAELALQESEKLYATLAAAAPVAICRFDAPMNCVYVSDRWSEMTGRPLESALGQGWIEAIHPEDRDRLLAPWNDPSTLPGLVPPIAMQGIEGRHLRPDGSINWFYVQTRPKFDARGQVCGCISTLTDITPLKQIEAELTASEAKYRRLVEGGQDLIWSIDVEERFTYLSPQFKTLFGWEPSEWIGRPVAEAIYVDDLQWILEHKTIAQVSAEVGCIEFRHRHRDLPYVWVRVSTTPIFDPGGQIVGFQGTLADITDRKTAEFALQASERRYASLATAAPVAIFRFDQPLHCVYVNERWSEMTGRPTESAMGHGWMEALHPDDRELAIAGWTKIYAQNTISDVPISAMPTVIATTEGRHLRPDGTVNWFYAQVAQEFDDQGNIISYVGTLTDITDRKQSEQLLQDLSARLELAIQSAQLGIWEYNFVSGRLTWDDRMLAIYGLQPEDFGGTHQDWENRVHPDDLAQALSDLTTNENLFLKEFRIVCPDGSIRHVFSSALRQRDEQGQLTRCVGINLDVTDRKQAEAQLQHINEELLRATRLKDEFLANMSHELRTPLNAILGMTEVLQEGVFGEMNAKQLKSLATVERSGFHLLELINEILDLSKIEAGRIELVYSAVAVRHLCQSSMTFVRQQALEKSIQLHLEVPPNLPDIRADERRIRQVLINLLSNAVKFTPVGGRITLAVVPLPFDQMCNQSYLRFSVTDTGIGITPENLKKLFQPFVQIDSALNRQYEGTGLGLALVKRIVEFHQGRVSVASEVGVGSCFGIELPYATAEQDPAISQTELPLMPEPPQAEQPTVAPLILLAEDNEANISTFSSYLQARGYRIQVANNGQAAIDLALAEPPHLMLMDVQMPGVDGLMAIRQIRQIAALAQVPIIALTALAMTGDRERCLEAGANDYLSKPVKLKQLDLLIRQLLADG